MIVIAVIRLMWATTLLSEAMTATALFRRTPTANSSAAAITKIPHATATVTTTAVADVTNAAAAVSAAACAVCSAAADPFALNSPLK